MRSPGRTYVVEVQQDDGSWHRVVSGWFTKRANAVRMFQTELLNQALMGRNVRLRALRGSQR